MAVLHRCPSRADSLQHAVPRDGVVFPVLLCCTDEMARTDKSVRVPNDGYFATAVLQSRDYFRPPCSPNLRLFAVNGVSWGKTCRQHGSSYYRSKTIAYKGARIGSSFTSITGFSYCIVRG